MRKSKPGQRKSKPLQFLEKAETDPKLSARVDKAIERGGKVTAEEVLQIANEFGFSFTRKEFEKEMTRNMAERFDAGEAQLARPTKPKPKPKPPLESTCAKGCLSWTINYCPRLTDD
jgi:hypothetical protein